MKLIGLAGKKGAGKDCVADMLVKREGFKKVAFADPLKELCSKVFRLDLQYFYDEKLKEKVLPDGYLNLDYHHLDKIRDIVQHDWGFPIDDKQREGMEEYYGYQIKTPREMMQLIGTDILRTFVRDDIWIVLFFLRIKDFGSNIIVSDVRLKNEREALKNAGAQLLLVKRYSDSKDKHISENDLGTEADYDVVIKNEDITLQVLESEVLMWYSVKVKHK